MHARRSLAAAAILTTLLWSGVAGATNFDNRAFGAYVKGGVGRYTAGYEPYTNYGATYGAGFLIQPLNFLSVEVGYDGAFNSTRGPLFSLLPDQPAAVRNGVSGLLKISAPLGWFRPFVGAGFGVSWLTPIGTGSSFLASRFLQELPLSGGLEFAIGPVYIGARFTYRFLFNADFIQDPSRARVSGGAGDVQTTFAYRF